MLSYKQFSLTEGTILHHFTNDVHGIIDSGHIKGHYNISDRSNAGAGVSTTRNAHYDSSAIGGKNYSIGLHKHAVQNVRHAKIVKVRDRSHTAEKESEERVVHSKGSMGGDVKIPFDKKHVHHVMIHHEEPSKDPERHTPTDKKHLELEKRLKEKGIPVHYSHKSGEDHGYHKTRRGYEEPKANRRITHS